MRRYFIVATALIFIFLLLSGGTPWSFGVSEARAQGWEAVVAADPNGPSLFLGIDKDSQELYLFSQQSPLTVSDRFACTTGESPGDKFEEGDLKTPEGVYFIKSRLDSGLDYELYGNRAYTLNFPNPIDRMKGKTGSGIWLHGRGHDIVPRETKGCIAMNNPDLEGMEDILVPGTPVLVAKSLQWTEGQDQDPESLELAQRVMDWANAWSEQSEEFFSFYDAENYPAAQGESFTVFENHKQNLFRTLKWIRVKPYNLHILRGPDYWVTWFEQLYLSSGLRTEGIKRLYWQKGPDGVMRIVGKEWIGATLGLEEKYLEEVTNDMALVVESWRKAWEQADLAEYMRFYDENASQAGRYGAQAIQDQKKALWQEKKPTRVGIKNIEVSFHPTGLQVSFIQEYSDETHYSDTGRKTLVFRPAGDGWAIVSENWSSM